MGSNTKIELELNGAKLLKTQLVKNCLLWGKHLVSRSQVFGVRKQKRPHIQEGNTVGNGAFPYREASRLYRWLLQEIIDGVVISLGCKVQNQSNT